MLVRSDILVDKCKLTFKIPTNLNSTKKQTYFRTQTIIKFTRAMSKSMLTITGG